MSEDAQLVERLKRDLEADGSVVWLAHDRLLAGDRWLQKIREAIEGGAFFIACFSANSVAKIPNVMNQEIVIAIEQLQRRPQNQRWFLPVKLTPCEIPEWDIGGGQTLGSIHHEDLSRDWDAGVRKLKLAMEITPPPRPPRRRLSRATWLLAVLTLVIAGVYGLAVSRYWPGFERTSTAEQPSDGTAIGFLSEALAHIEADRIEEAYHSAVSAEKAARTPAVQNRALAMRLLLAISLSEAHQMLGETLVAGQQSSREADKIRFAELAVGQSMQSFRWAKIATGPMDALSARQLPEVHFSKVELSNALGDRMTAGIEAGERIRSGGGVPPQEDLDRAVAMLAAQAFRFNIIKALQPDADKVAMMSRGFWEGRIQWSPELAMTISEHIVKMSGKGVQMALAVESRAPEDRFDPGRSFGLGEELNLAFCRSLLEPARRFVMAARATVDSAEDAVALNTRIQQVDSLLQKIRDREQGAP